MGMLRRLRLSIVLPAALVSVFLSAGPARAAVITVTTTAESPGAAGDCTLGEAMQAAETDSAVDGCAAGSGADTIGLLAGTYALTTGVGTAVGVSAFQVSTTVTILGNGATLTRDPANTNLRFFEVTSTGNLTLDDLTLSSGRAVGLNGVVGAPGGPGQGGAIHNSGTLTLSAIGLMGNRASGGVGSSDNSMFGMGEAGGAGQGGAIYNAGSLTLLTVTFTDNSAQGGRGGTANAGIGGPGGVGQGGALYHLGTSTSTLTIVDGRFAQNQAIGGSTGVSSVFLDVGNPAGDASGGGLHGESDVETGSTTVSITQSRMTANEAVGASWLDGPAFPGQGLGGAISMAGVALTLTQSTVSGNAARGGAAEGGAAGLGGGLHVQNANVHLTRTAIIGNTAVGGVGFSAEGIGNGGGLYAATAQLFLTNVTASDNDAKNGGGGVYTVGSGNVALRHVTLANNTSTTGAAGVVAASAATATFAGTVVANNAGSGGNCSGVIANLGGNLQFPGTTCGAGIPVADPLLGPLRDESGTTVHPLLPLSPAVDAADQPDCPATDQRGVMRPIDGDDDGFAVCDIGAYEAVPDDLIFRDGFET